MSTPILTTDIIKKCETNEERRRMRNDLVRTIDSSREHDSNYNEIFSREFVVDSNKHLMRLVDKFPSNVMIIGTGGIGSWVAFFLARMKTMYNIILVDPDIVEISNLGRTPFTQSDIGHAKVEICSRFIVESSPDINVFPLKTFFNENVVNAINNIFLLSDDYFNYNKSLTIIDCRDNEFRDYNILDGVTELPKEKIHLYRVAYDGEYITLDYNPANTISNGAGGYETQPSQVLPSSLAALISLLMILKRDNYNDTEIKSFPITFNVTRLIDYIFISKNFLQFSNSDLHIGDFIKKIYKEDYVVKKITEENDIFGNLLKQ